VGSREHRSMSLWCESSGCARRDSFVRRMRRAEKVVELARDWFLRHLKGRIQRQALFI
jgi:hypothetical protein